MDRSYIFKMAWSDYKLLLKHNIKKPFGVCLSHQFGIAKLIEQYHNGAEVKNTPK